MEEDRNRLEIRSVYSSEQIAQVRSLFEEYWAAFGFTPCFQGFDQERASLPRHYAPSRARLLLAMVHGEPAGCVALCPFDETRGEVKRLHVRPRFRGHKIGEALRTRWREKREASATTS